jgi:predicted RNA polymerase sigma factor
MVQLTKEEKRMLAMWGLGLAAGLFVAAAVNQHHRNIRLNEYEYFGDLFGSLLLRLGEITQEEYDNSLWIPDGTQAAKFVAKKGDAIKVVFPTKLD